MPELPEVETVRRGLEKTLPGRSIERVMSAEPFMLRDIDAGGLDPILRGRKIETVWRRGKFLIVEMTGGVFMTFHLGMSGRLLIVPRDAPVEYERFSFSLGDPEGRKVRAPAPEAAQGLKLSFADMRKFGRLHVTEGGPAERLEALGPDAWQGEWDAAWLGARLAGRTAPVKAFLLDQRHLAGIGNIYADEILWAAGISPLRPAGALSAAEVGRLSASIRDRLAEGVRLRGCTVSTYVGAGGEPGSFQEVLRAYRQHGEPCTVCGTVMARAKVAGRTTSYCPTCQK